MNRCRSLSTHLGRVISGVEYRHRETETVVITKVVDKRGGRKKERAVVRPGQKGTRVSSRSRMDPGCMPVLGLSRLQLELEVGVSWVSGVRLQFELDTLHRCCNFIDTPTRSSNSLTMARALSSSALFIPIFIFALSLKLCTAHMIEVGASKKECFFEDLHKNDQVSRGCAMLVWYKLCLTIL